MSQWESLVDRVLRSEEPADEEQELPTMHGIRTFLTRVVPERSADGGIHTVLSTSHDITKLKSLQQQLAELARTDPLTLLGNRRAFDAAAADAVGRPGRALPALDVDLVALGWGFTPSMELISAVGAQTRLDVDQSLVAVVDASQRSTTPGVPVPCGRTCR